MNHTPEPARHTHQAPAAAGTSPSGDPTVLEQAATLDGDTAVQLILANTTTGQTILDLDGIPVLSAAAVTTGRRYRVRRLGTSTAPARSGAARAARAARVSGAAGERADLVVLRWPRPDSTPPRDAASSVFAIATAHLQPGGHVAVLLEPTRIQAFTITWTGALLTAAARAGLTYLQDILCIHTPRDDEPADGAQGNDPLGGRGLHRVILVLRTEADRHAR